jgi:DNA-directed RNA polymerase subunit E'/Rpb7
MSIFLPIRFKSSVQLTPADLRMEIDEILLRKLKDSYEGKCTRYGYIAPGSLQILKRSMGMCVKQHFNGHMKYEIVCRAEACNPPVMTTVSATVKNKNELGIYAESIITVGDRDIPVLDIIVPKTVGFASEVDLNSVQTGQTIYVKVLTKKFKLYDKQISIIGTAVASMNANDDDKSDVVIMEDAEHDHNESDDEEEVEYSDDEDSSEKSDDDNDSADGDEIKGPIPPMDQESEEEEEEVDEEEEELLEEDYDGAGSEGAYSDDYDYES